MDKANAGKEMLQVSHTKDETERLTVDHHTERKPIGVAETGVLIRKTSIRRRISKDETTEDRSFGHRTDDYMKICERVMADGGVQKTLEALQEKWRMIMFMYDDCMDLKKEKAEQSRIRNRKYMKKQFIALLIIYVLITLPLLLTTYLAFLFVIWFLTTAV